MTRISAVYAALLCLFPGCSRPRAIDRPTANAAASTEQPPAPGALVRTVARGGSAPLLEALVTGPADLCQPGPSPGGTRIAFDALAVFVNEESPLREISIAALRRIYTGAATNLRDFGAPDRAIVPYGRERGSGKFAYFREDVLGNEDPAANVRTFAGAAAVVDAVRGDPSGIGYGGPEHREGVRELRIQRDTGSPGVPLSLQTAERGTYPLSRAIYLCTLSTPGPAAGGAERFIDWVLGPEGQALVASAGFYPLRPD